MSAAIASRPAPRTSGIADVQTPAGRKSPTVYAAWLDNACTRGEAVSSDGQTIYTVRRYAETTYTCSCEGNAVWNKTCKHIKALAALATPVPATCIGYGHLHAAAPGSNVQMYWCEVCDHEATPKAAAIIVASATGASFGRQERQKDAWL